MKTTKEAYMIDLKNENYKRSLYDWFKEHQLRF